MINRNNLDVAQTIVESILSPVIETITGLTEVERG